MSQTMFEGTVYDVSVTGHSAATAGIKKSFFLVSGGCDHKDDPSQSPERDSQSMR